MSSKVRNGGLKAIDFAAGQLPTGQQGPPGPSGPPGPTAAAVSAGDRPPAASSPGGFDLVTTTITTTSQGNVLVGANISQATPSGAGPGVTCGAGGACSVTFGVYLDGIPVPGTARSISAAAGLNASLPAIILLGIASNVPAGPHAVKLRVQVVTGPLLGTLITLTGPAQVHAIAVG